MENRNYFIIGNYGCHEVKISVDEVWFHGSLDSVRIICSDSSIPVFLRNEGNSSALTQNDVYNAIVDEFNRVEEFLKDITLSDVTKKSYVIFTKYCDNVICVKVWVNFVSHKASIFSEYSSGIKSVPLNQSEILAAISREIQFAKKQIDIKCVKNNDSLNGVFGLLINKINRRRLVKKYPDFFGNSN